MKLKRNTTADGMGKYSLIEHEKGGRVEHGLPGTENEFFVIKLKDRNALPALIAYADSVEKTDPDFAMEVRGLADRAGIFSQWRKDPD